MAEARRQILVIAIADIGAVRINEVCETISAWLAEQPGWRVLGVTESPITGAEGNREFLIAGVFSG